MIIPGSNLLNLANTVIKKQTLNYYKNISSGTLGTTGKYVPTYEDVVEIQGNFQPIPRRLYQQYGLDFNKEYANLYVNKNIIGVDRNLAGDEIGFQESRYKCQSVTPWFGLDGWNAVLCVRTGDD